MTVPRWFFNDLHIVLEVLQAGDADHAANLLQVLLDSLSFIED